MKALYKVVTYTAADTKDAAEYEAKEQDNFIVEEVLAPEVFKDAVVYARGLYKQNVPYEKVRALLLAFFTIGKSMLPSPDAIEAVLTWTERLDDIDEEDFNAFFGTPGDVEVEPEVE